MVNCALAFHLVFLLAADPLPQSAQKELKLLQGDWELLSGEAKGEKLVSRAGDAKLILTFKGDKWIFTGAEKGIVTAIDPKSRPKCMEIKSTEEGKRGKMDYAIYKLEGDILTICLYQGPGKQRPTKFESLRPPDTILAVFKRVKKR